MSVDFQKLYSEAVSYWPESISCDDKEFLKNGGLKTPRLTNIHNEIEYKIFQIEDNYTLRHMDWAIYTVLHTMAEVSNVVRLKEINTIKVKAVFYENIKP